MSSTVVHVHHLVGLTEIAEMFGVSRQRAGQLADGDGFPLPEAELAAGRIWARSKVEAWARKAGRDIVDPHV